MTTMKQSWWMKVMLVLCLGVAMLAAGCHSAPGRDKKFGTYYQHIAGSRDLVAEAARQVMGEMGYLTISDEVDAGVAKLKYRTAFDTKITVSVDPAGVDHCRVGVRVSPGHSEGLSQNVLRRIQERLAGAR